MNFVKNLSFWKKIFLGMIVAAIIPMIGGYLLLLQVLNFTYRSNLNQEGENTLDMGRILLEQAFSDIYGAMEKISSNQYVIEFFQAQENVQREAIYRELYTITSKYGDYAYFSLYDNEGVRKMTVVNNRYVPEKLSVNWNVLYEAQKEPSSYVVRNARFYEGTEKVEFLRVGHAITNPNGEIEGYVVATMEKSSFDNILKGIVREKQGAIYLMDSFQELVYCSKNSFSQEEYENTKKALLQTGSPYLSVDNNDFYYMEELPDYGLFLMYRQPIASLNNMKNYVREIAVASGVISILVCLLLSWHFSRSIYKPIERMQKAISEIRKGNYQTKIKVSSEDELGQLSESFNVMAEHLEENTQRLIQRERELSDANIKMMQAQLNPHFLYNTLDTMKWMAKENDLPEVVSLSSDLAQILRMSISARPMIRLIDEISLVEAYAEIQKIRFEDKFEMIVDVPEELENCLVPKLILQPIVENAIIHGLIERENGFVLIQAEEQGEKKLLEILIQDNGMGMTEEEVTKLNEFKTLPHTEESGHTSIGFYNVNAIIQLHYGKEFGLRAESEEGVGTKIYIRLPIQL